MKPKFHLLAGAVLAAGVSLSAFAQTEPAPAFQRQKGESGPAATSRRTDPSPTPMGPEKSFDEFAKIKIMNFQDEPLGRIKDLGIDLVNGRIVEVLIASDSSIDEKHKIVAVPPLALIPDFANKVYRLNVSVEDFKAAPGIDLKNWRDDGRSQRVAAAYYHFGQMPYFLEEGATASTTASRPKVALGYVERANQILDLPVGNLQGEKFGKVWSLTMDIPKGRILNVIVLAPGNFKTKSIVPPMALSFNSTRDELLLDQTKSEFANEPRYVFTETAFGNDATYERESYTGPKTSIALEQGDSYLDVDRSVLINREIRTANISARNVQIGTMNGRVTLRGWVNTNEEKRRIGEIAAAAARAELVDNQITVGKVARNE